MSVKVESSLREPKHDETAAAALLGLRPQTLRLWRVRGCGPRFLKIGRLVRYPKSALEEFMSGRLVSNTAEAAEVGA